VLVRSTARDGWWVVGGVVGGVGGCGRVWAGRIVFAHSPFSRVGIVLLSLAPRLRR
jgi:hypothetical protein